MGATGVTATAAFLCGQLSSAVTGSTEVSVFWGLSDGGTVAGNWDSSYNLGVTENGSLNVGITGMPAAVAHYYAYRASNAAAVTWGTPPDSFVTEPAQLSVWDAEAVEGAAGNTSLLVFALSLSAASGPDVSMTFSVTNRSAEWGVRSADWIWASYATVKDQDSFCTYGRVERWGGFLILLK